MSQTDEGVEDLPVDDEEEEEFEEEEEEEAEHWSLYDSESFISRPFYSDKSTILEDVLQFQYDCRKYFNLTSPDPDTVLFASGNFINFFDVPSRTISFRRSALGGGVGHIKANPNPEFNHVAIAENGQMPLIIIYEWPTLDIVCVLKGGSSGLYSHLDFSNDGMFLVSQGGDPDYLITIWNWQKRRILLRTKSYVNDVYRVKFSPYVPGQLTTCGVSHIKFWKMARTFTGLKLKGELGRFGKTEFSDILGLLPMPDEKVVSGCAWGNILVWDAGLIKLEVFRTLRRKCHEAPIVQISFSEGELMTAAMDGHVKVWWYDKIDQADPPDDDRVIQIDPTYDFYTPGLMLMCMRKRYPDPKDTTYFAQDGNGGIWIIDLNTYDTPKESVQIYRCHAGRVVAVASCPWGPYLVSLGEDGRVYVYDYVDKEQIFDYQYPAKGTCMIWISPKISPTGDELVMGFDDGSLRLSILVITDETVRLVVTQTIKPHQKPITQITFNPTNEILVSGSEDRTIFFFQVVPGDHVDLAPIGYIHVPDTVTCFTWHCHEDDELLVGCLRGEIVQVKVPKEPVPYTTVSYLLALETKQNRFKTYKSQIRRDIKLREIEERKAKKVAKKRVEMERVKAENPGLDIDEELFLADSESEEELEPLYIPEIPNRVIWMQSTEEGTIWLSMGGYDAGYAYEYKIDQKSNVPHYFKMIDDADDIEISSYIYNYNKKYLIFAMQNGEIRVNKIEDGNYRELSDYWSLAMHDNQNGFVPNMCFSYDEKYFFTCGHDGNVFSYTFHPEDKDYLPPSRRFTATRREKIPQGIRDEAHHEKLSLEQASLKKEQDRIDRLAARHKQALRERLRRLKERFFRLLRRNKRLMRSQIVPPKELEVDRRVTEYLDEKLDEEMELVKRKLAFDVQKSEVRMMKLRQYFVDNLIYIPLIVTGLNTDLGVKMLRQNKVSVRNDEMLKIVDEKIREEELKSRPFERAPPPPKLVIPKKTKEPGLEYFLVNLSMSELQKHGQLWRLLAKYRARKAKWEKRDEEWEAFLAKKPVKGVNHPDDDAALAEATVTVGDYKLKTDKKYKAPQEERVTTVKKYKELLLARVKQSQIRFDFNKKVYDLRNSKIKIREELGELKNQLEQIHKEIPSDKAKQAPSVRDSHESEFAERDFEINVELKVEDEFDEVRPRSAIVLTLPSSADSLERLVLPKNSKKFKARDLGDVADLDFETLCNFSKNEKRDCAWEAEARERRLERKFFEQDEIINAMNKKISDFDSYLEELNSEKFTVEVNAKVMDIFMVTLQQELLILKEFEALEDTYQSKVNAKVSEFLDMKDIIDEISAQVVLRNRGIEKGQEEIKMIQMNFALAAQDNKFYDFLRKVFRKKYRPPKVRKDDESSSDESSSSSSESSESDDEGRSIDSRDFGIIKQDLNVCPKGCDPSIYDYAIKQRTERHTIEVRVKEELKTIEVLKKELEIQNKKVKIIEKELKACENELEKYQRQKQHKLNEVRCTIILSLDQLQHLTPEYTTSNINETLVFSKSRLSRLYKRTEELQGETFRQDSRHKLNIRHFTRMRTDCNYMAQKIKSLQEEIAARMKMKFGKVVDINEIEEAMLRRTFGKDDLRDLEEVLLKKIVHDVRLGVMDIRGMYLDELNAWTNNIAQAQKDLAYALRYNTAQKELLSHLVKEKAELEHALISQERKKQLLQGEADLQKKYSAEMANLRSIVEEQTRQMQELRIEIKTLRTKGMVLPPVEERKEEVEEEVKVWDHLTLLDQLDEEEEEDETQYKPFSTEIRIPTTLHAHSQAVATEVVGDMLKTLDVKIKSPTELFVRDILESVMRGLSVTELVDELIRNLPIKPDESQMEVIQSTAEQLYVVGEPDVKRFSARDILEDTVEEVLAAAGGSGQEVLNKMVEILVETVPSDFLQEQSSIDYINKKLTESRLDVHLSRDVMTQLVHTQEAVNILDEIVESVFGTGIDLLYYIKDH